MSFLDAISERVGIHSHPMNLQFSSRVASAKLSSRLSKPQRVPRRSGRLISIWIQPRQKRTLEELADRTGINQSKLVRRALELLFDQVTGLA